MEGLIGGFIFGLIIGYLSWYAFRPGETKETIPIEKLGAFIAIILGATILSLFPAGTTIFTAYTLGLAFGFFFVPIKTFLIVETEKEKESDKLKFQEEIDEIQHEWEIIEKVVKYKLDKDRVVETYDLNELARTIEGRVYIMRQYAKLHVNEGVDFDVNVDLNGYIYKLTKRY